MRKLCMGTLLYLFSTLSFASLPYFPVTFPRDEAAHYKNIPYQFQKLLEWWYFNGVATTDDGKHLSYDVAFFNTAAMKATVATRPMLHIQIADLDTKKSVGTAKIYPLNSGNISTEKLNIVLNDDYLLQQTYKNGKLLYQLHAEGKINNTTLKLDFILKPRSQPFLINRIGLIPMPNDTNSYYYSIPHFETTGTIEINATAYKIKNTPGDSWLDHQWGDFNVQRNGWEWFSIRLDNGLIANIFFNLEYKNNRVIDGIASIILPSGEQKFIPYKNIKVTRDQYWYDKNVAIQYPMTFTIEIPDLELTLTNTAAFAEQEIHGYWEGYCHVSAEYRNQHVNGFSYTELVYGNPTASLQF